ncbi:SprT-like domain-containing protein [Flavobacterium sp. xlx-214]|uniref:SprT-like domain-containing protein n=1 Tax=unclassified Flavobacterium TaxID=196869 RepID=UPI0013D0E2C1|nr:MULTISPECIES: SprT-like domain-containing protein [unclassified Flavobacterium]MBA5794098.1 SprT-like domain-containing protein [Flavobacterium sp. xlx-221]QMI84007.1 SprT-like domain-containing protein [Flavobacterium sp. xlx-214]
MKDILFKYLPEHAVAIVYELIKTHQVHLKIVNERTTRHGDYRKNQDGSHAITVNANLNKYRFLITTIHEIAHLVAFQKFGRNIKPHGIEWKQTFRLLMLPFINPSIFPNEVLPVVANHFKNPSASSDTDAILAMTLKKFDAPNQNVFVDEIPQGSFFRMKDGRVFKKGKLRVKLFECLEISTNKVYLFKPNAEVELVNVK